MSKQPVNQNAKLALNEMKMEISKELSDESNIKDDSNPIDSIGLSGRVGGQMSKRLVKIGTMELLKKYGK